MAGKTKDDYEATYTEPELRERLKEEIKASDRGGRKGQWSARKSQLLVQEYEKAGGGYHGDDRRTDTQRHLEQWGEQDWHTKGGGAEARGSGGTSRYLPDKAWKLLTPKEREATDRRKRTSDDQHVGNTDAAREARKAAEIADAKADEARRKVAALETASELRRARKAEKTLGRSRKTVLAAIERRLGQL